MVNLTLEIMVNFSWFPEMVGKKDGKPTGFTPMSADE